MLQDLRYALRTFARSPALVAAAVVCLALGIGANATIFGVVDTLLFRPPPHVQDPERVVRLYFRRHYPAFGMNTSSITGYPLYTLIRASARAFDALAAYTYAQNASLGRGVDARRVHVVLASASYFPLLGVRPALGRFYLADEDRPGGPSVVVLGYGFWRAAFQGDSGILGRQLQLGRGSYTVVGVAPERFTGVNLENVDAWVPLTAATPELMGPGSLNRGSYFLQIIGRLGPGGREPAQREATLAFRAEEVYSGVDSTAVALLGPVQHARGPEISQNARVSLWLTAVSVIVLLVACANVANLLLARALQRQREIAVRLALGVARLRLARLLVTESVLLALAGGVAALLVTLWAGPVIRAFLLPDMPALALAVDARVLLFTGGVALLTGFLAGLVPALQASRADLTPALKAGAREGHYRRSRLRAALLAGQVALTVTLIVGAGLFVRSLRNVQGQDFGFDPLRTLRVTMDLRAAGYRPAEINQLNLRMLARLEALPGVGAAAATIGHPLGWLTASSVSVPGRDSIPQLKAGGPYYQRVTAGYFAAMGTPVRGRAFTPPDRGAPVAIVSETMARLLWPGHPAIGKCFFVGSDKRCSEIVGVVPDARRFSAVEDVAMQFYVPFTDDSSEFITALVVRARGRPEDLVAPVRAAIQGTAANLPYADVTPLADLLAPSIRPWRLGSTMFSAFAVLALVLAAVGLYGVLAYTVAQRTQEIGIRVAMGARHGNVLGLMVGQGVKIAALGAGIGALAALAGGRVLGSLLYGVSPRDPLVLLGAAVIPLVVAAVASYVPARRAAKVDPVVALRYE
jgi:predicted permease